MVNLYSFVLILIPQENPSFSQGKLFSLSYAKQHLKLSSLFFCQPIFFEDISTPTLESTNKQLE